MHERSLISNLINKVEYIAREQKVSRVVLVKVRLGALSHISAEHFREHFERDCSGSIAEGALLEVDVSDDMDDPHAQEILLESVDVEE